MERLAFRFLYLIAAVAAHACAEQLPVQVYTNGGRPRA
jgi:hypothetical protein